MSEERFVANYFDQNEGCQMGGYFTYEELLDEYNGNEEIAKDLWNCAFRIPNDDETRTFIDKYKNGKIDTYTLTFKELCESCGYGEALEYWYGLMRGC